LAVRRRSSAGNCEDQTGSFRTIGSPVDRRSKIAVQAPNREAKPSGRRVGGFREKLRKLNPFAPKKKELVRLGRSSLLAFGASICAAD